jgi:D-3-phosphoglycerate dehydrogenase / 2-oxoglutarate reductase
LPNLVAVARVAVDIRNIDVDCASAHGVLITQASRIGRGRQLAGATAGIIEGQALEPSPRSARSWPVECRRARSMPSTPAG